MICLKGKVSLQPEHLLRAYSCGIFPMHDGRGLRWFTNDPRGILPLDDGFHIPRRFATSLRRFKEAGRFRTTCDTCFREVLVACAYRPKEGTWISPSIIDAYHELHRLGYAHSIEVWDNERLAGGLYGVSLGRAFFGESIFSAHADAGKVALVELVRRLRIGGYELLDIQMVTELTASFGGTEIPLTGYLTWLSSALSGEPVAGSWTASGSLAGTIELVTEVPDESSSR